MKKTKKTSTIAKAIYSLFLFAIMTQQLFAGTYFFHISLSDKNHTPYSLYKPQDYLSERALERRRFFHISIDSTDLPLNPRYLREIEERGLKIHCKSKWLNTISVSTSDSSSIELLQGLSFVKEIKYSGEIKLDTTEAAESKKRLLKKAKKTKHSDWQIKQLKGDFLHNSGYEAKNIHIAVLDAGFKGTNTAPAFEKLYSENRLLGTKNFVTPQNDVYTSSAHGTYVLSAMAARIPKQYKGTATKASYWLLETEQQTVELPVEMDFWIAAIEFADSVGVDLVNSSLGYSQFELSKLKFTHNDLDGETVSISKAANLAAKKGILLVNAAGNEGDKDWKKIGFPADAKGIVSVGAITRNAQSSVFSSYGPSSDGRIKPELCALGEETVLMNEKGCFKANGTSYSTPLITGLLACFLEFAKENAKLDFSLEELLHYIFTTAENNQMPSEKLGYGTPDFETAAKEFLKEKKIDVKKNEISSLSKSK